MIFCRHIPKPPLAQHIAWLWFYEGLNPAHRREHVLPDGTFEFIVDLCHEPRKLFRRRPPRDYQSFRRGWLSGTHSEYIVIDALPNSSMIGAHFKPGGAAPFLGIPAQEVADAVVQMDEIWGQSALELREQLLAAS
jgi:hypothetical protein